MSRYGTHLPVFAFSRHENSLRRAALYRGVETIRFDSDSVNYVDANEWAVGKLIERGVLNEGDLVIISKGDVANVVGGTNTLKIVEVGKPIAKG